MTAPLINPKPINANAAQIGPKNKTSSPARTNTPFQIILTNLLFILMENTQCAKGGINVIATIMEAISAKVLV